MIDRRDFVQEQIRSSSIWTEVLIVADELIQRLSTDSAQAALAAANQPGASSSTVQAVLLEAATALGFRDESRGLFSGYASSALRPDFHLPMPLHEDGILMEVERGKTTINNMDLLDFWKCHICAHASFLFLLVPRELRQNESLSVRREFNSVSRRLESFFMPNNYTNVRGLVLFGY